MSRAHIVRGLVLVAVLAWNAWPSQIHPRHRRRAGPSGYLLILLSGQPPEWRPSAWQLPNRWYHGTGGLWTIIWTHDVVPIPRSTVQRNGWLYLEVSLVSGAGKPWREHSMGDG